ncbi:HNH endonuclease [Phytohabitans houttuyneae]|uniref:HNH nuclease domain-containing protein n=1 Tax=Phytohabitans houttuyneae TaxID=1076126 RepID=A0A6V8KAK2_9ACTN|nr:hypothetical protein Phou_036710 [Phytohabitans houttuyneae]
MSAKARGWCGTHYNRWHQYGDPEAPVRQRPVRLCEVAECRNKYYAKGFCRRHHTRFYYETNRERVKASQAVYRAANRETARERSREWRRANPERATASVRAWYATNRERVREYRRRYRASNRDVVRAANSRRKALHKNAPVNDLTARQWREIKAVYRFRCAYCRRRLPLTIDHVVPLSKGGPHTASNVVPACQRCNSRKGDRAAPIFQPLLF